MAFYDYRCSECDVRFEASVPMAEADTRIVPCPSGHLQTRRLLPMIATVRSGGGSPSPSPSPMSGGGGCGGGCACAH